jgi:hypothetical protein
MGVDVLERFVEGMCGKEDLSRLSWDVEGAAFCVEAGDAPWQRVVEQLPLSVLADLAANPDYSPDNPRRVLTSAAYFVDAIFSPQPWERRTRTRPRSEGGSLFRPVSLVHDVAGNPFRPATTDPSWLTSTVVALARGIDDERAFDRLPILADALQDAGCDHPDILTHCRSDGPHVRGCWVVDLILGKS